MTKLNLLYESQPKLGEARGLRGGDVSGPKTYRMKFLEERDRPGKEIEFEAEDAYQALVIVREEARRRAAAPRNCG